MSVLVKTIENGKKIDRALSSAKSCNDWNHKKIIALGRVMCTKTMKAGPDLVDTVQASANLEASLNGEAIAKWMEMAVKWEESSANPNPFETLQKDDHLAKVRSDLAREAAERAAKGEEEEDDVQEDMHVTEFIAVGLQLEEQQRTLKFDADASGLHPTDDQRRTMTERSSKLRRKIEVWMDTQTKFFPIVTKLREAEERTRKRGAKAGVVPGIKVEEMALWLPSAMWKGNRPREDVCRAEVLQHEYRMRVGQANEALDEIRRQLLVRTHLYREKDDQAPSVRTSMRSLAKIKAVDDRIRRCAAQYRVAYAALEVLGPAVNSDGWKVSLQPLLVEDVRERPRKTIGDEERQRARGKLPKRKRQKKKTKERPMSWIWVVQGKELVEGEDPELNEALRTEWAKTRARVLRWTEDTSVRLLSK
ncbi:hypothetical protein B0H11DRAFT_2247451 [Mycena galericulata]|nr:hypothetical protein B0H11DRAFT_2247451 [Mycena galericulata]